nr:MAG TPA: hypothetical protein [Caudoviricetes sp.]
MVFAIEKIIICIKCFQTLIRKVSFSLLKMMSLILE